MSSVSFAELRGQRAFFRFWYARVAGTTANQMLLVAVAWQMYDLTGSAWDLGLVGLFQFAPALLAALPAGHCVDRGHRGRIFALVMFGQVVVALALAAASWHAMVTRELILSLSVLLGLARAFQMPAQQALTPLLVPAALLPRAVALASSGVQASIIGGPALGGLLYTQGVTLVYAVCVVLFALGGVLTAGLRYVQPERRALSGDWRSMLAGAVFVWRHKVLLGATSLDLFAVLLGGAVALLPIYARDILNVGPVGLGVLRAAPAAGALTMSLVLTRWPLQRHVGRRMLLAVGAFGIATLVFGLSTNVVVSVIALAATGAADMVSVVTRQTLAQLETPDEMRGRVAAVNSIFIGASNQLGEFESGATAAWFGAVGSVVFGGVGTLLVATLWVRVFPELAQRDHMHQACPRSP